MLTEENKKMFKMFGMLIGGLVVILVLFFIIIAIMGSKVSNDKLVNLIERATVRYYNDHSEELPKNDGESVRITSETLISNKYMKSFDKSTRNTGCSAEIKTTNNNGQYLHIVSLYCSEYKTREIIDVLKENVVTSGNGLYASNGTYYYRGEYVNNYIKLADKIYRIVSIDSNNNIKLVESTTSNVTYPFDNRYNVERKQDSLGINDYAKSRSKETIDEAYEKYDDSLKKYIINYDWCTAKRGLEDGSMSLNECSSTVKDYVGLITPIEYARVSLDSNCKSVLDGACANYNYLYNIYEYTVWTLTGVAENTYQAFTISYGYVEEKRTNNTVRASIMFNISGENTYISGDGTEAKPYIIK